MKNFLLCSLNTRALLVSAMVMLSGLVYAQKSITALNSAVSEDFNSLVNSGSVAWTDNSTIVGVYARTDANQPATISANDGNTYTNGLYSFGTGTGSNRAFGYVSALSSYFGTSGKAGYLGIRLRNNSGTTITDLTVQWDGEQWRNKSDGSQTINLSYKIGTTVTSVIGTGWTTISNPLFSSPYSGATDVVLDGHDAANRTAAITATISGLNIPAGSEVMLRWVDKREALSGSSDILAIDNVVVTADGYPSNPIALPATGITTSGFTAHWKSAQYADKYLLTIYDDEFNPVVDQEVTSLSYVYSSANPGKTYTYEVIAYKGILTSEVASNSVTTYTEADDGKTYVFQDLDGGDNYWSTASNWSSNTVPGIYNSATIDANCVVNANDPVCNNLTINSGKTVTINPGKLLTVNGEITQINASNSTIRLLSNSLAGSGTGMLLHFNSGVRGTIERYVTGMEDGTGPLYHLVSVPINTSSTPQYSMVFLDSYLAYYNESEGGWTQMHTPTNNAIYSSRGYLTYDPTDANDVYEFGGVLNYDEVSMNVGYSGASNGWNLVGNPYTMTLDWESDFGWTKTNIDNTIYVWDAANHRYATYIDGVGTNGGSRYIAPGQGFFVHSNASGPALVSNYLTRTTETTPFLKAKEATPDLLRLVSTIEDHGSDEIVIRFDTNASSGFDRQFDAFNLSSMAGLKVPDLFSIGADDVKYSIQARQLEGETLIPIGFKYESDAVVSFNFSGIQSFITHPNLGVYLEDTKTGSLIDLKETSEYSFQYIAADESDRFILKIGTALGVFPVSSGVKQCQVFMTTGNNLMINHSMFVGKQGLATVYDASGNTLFRFSLDHDGYTKKEISNVSGLLLVKLEFSGVTESHKLICH